MWDNNGKGVIPIVLVGYNVDKRDTFLDTVPDEEVKKYCVKLTERTKNLGFEVKYYPTSLETGLNLQECFDYLGKICFKYLEMYKKTHR